MLDKYAERFRSIGKTIDSIRKDAYKGVVKDVSTRQSPALFNSHDLQGDLAMIKADSVDVFSFEEEDVERRDNFLAYYAEIIDAFNGRDFEQKDYVKDSE